MGRGWHGQVHREDPGRGCGGMNRVGINLNRAKSGWKQGVCVCVYVCVCVFKEAGWEGAGKNPVPHQSGNRLPQNQGRGPTPWQGCLASRGYL